MKLLAFSPNGVIVNECSGDLSQSFRSEIAQIEAMHQAARCSMGVPLPEYPTDYSVAQAGYIGSRIREFYEWQDIACSVISKSFGHAVSFSEDDLSIIGVPWWNEPVAGCMPPSQAGAIPIISTGSRSAEFLFRAWHPMHSYAVEMQRNYVCFQRGRRAMLVGACIITSDERMVFGKRGGVVHRGGISIVPGGSMGCFGSLQSILSESKEELSLTPQDFAAPPIRIAVVEIDDKRIGFSFLIRLKIHSDEIPERHQRARDKYEHTHVFSVPCEPDKLSQEHICHEYARLYGGGVPPFFSVAASVLETCKAALFGPKYLRDFFSNDEQIRRCV